MSTLLPEGTDVHTQQHIHQKHFKLCLPLSYYGKVIVNKCLGELFPLLNFEKFWFYIWFVAWLYDLRHRWLYFTSSQQTLNVDSTLIYVEITSRRQSTWICQRWFVDKFQRWNNVDFGLTLKTILFSYHHALKIKIFKSTLKRWPYFNVETTSAYQR